MTTTSTWSSFKSVSAWNWQVRSKQNGTLFRSNPLAYANLAIYAQTLVVSGWFGCKSWSDASQRALESTKAMTEVKLNHINCFVHTRTLVHTHRLYSTSERNWFRVYYLEYRVQFRQQLISLGWAGDCQEHEEVGERIRSANRIVALSSLETNRYSVAVASGIDYAKRVVLPHTAPHEPAHASRQGTPADRQGTPADLQGTPTDRQGTPAADTAAATEEDPPPEFNVDSAKWIDKTKQPLTVNSPPLTVNPPPLIVNSPPLIVNSTDCVDCVVLPCDCEFTASDGELTASECEFTASDCEFTASDGEFTASDCEFTASDYEFH
eukprot:607954-Prorocentrum_minimum.AAC.5